MGTRILQTDLARDALYTKVNQIGDEKVDLSSDQTITGTKTFTSDLYVKDDVPAVYLQENDTVKGTNPQNEQVWSIYNQDSSSNLGNSHRLGIFTTHLRTDGTTVTWMGAYKNEADSESAATIRVFYPQTGNPYTYAPQPTDTNSTGSQQIATVGWVNNQNIATNIVHKNGNENIEGLKNFTWGAVHISSSGITKGTPPSEIKYLTYSFNDKNGTSYSANALGTITLSYDTNGTIRNSLVALKPQANSTASAAISVYYPSSGNPYTSAPTPTDTTSTSSTQIATVGWVNNAGNNLVHLTGTESITGSKTFTSKLSTASIELYPQGSGTQPYIDFHFNSNSNDYTSRIIENSSGELRVLSTFFIVPTPNQTTSTSSVQAATVGWVNTVGNNLVHLTDTEEIGGLKTFTDIVNLKDKGYNYKGYRVQNINVIKGTAPTTNNVGGQFVFHDSTNLAASGRIGGLEVVYQTDGKIVSRLQAFKPEASSTTNASISIVYPTGADPYTTAPTPSVSSNTNNIATTAYVNAKIKKVSTLPANPDSNVFYFIPE